MGIVNSRRLCIAIGILVLLASQPTLAAPKCLDSTVSQRLKRSTAVFTGEALEVRPVEHFLETRFRITETFKGTAEDTELRVLTYPISPETPNFEPSRSYLVFAHSSRGKLIVGGCGGTVEIRYAEESISKVRRLIRNRKGPRS
jgi:hypothetical protein